MPRSFAGRFGCISGEMGARVRMTNVNVRQHAIRVIDKSSLSKPVVRADSDPVAAGLFLPHVARRGSTLKHKQHRRERIRTSRTWCCEISMEKERYGTLSSTMLDRDARRPLARSRVRDLHIWNRRSYWNRTIGFRCRKDSN